MQEANNEAATAAKRAEDLCTLLNNLSSSGGLTPVGRLMVKKFWQGETLSDSKEGEVTCGAPREEKPPKISQEVSKQERRAPTTSIQRERKTPDKAGRMSAKTAVVTQRKPRRTSQLPKYGHKVEITSRLPQPKNLDSKERPVFARSSISKRAKSAGSMAMKGTTPIKDLVRKDYFEQFSFGSPTVISSKSYEPASGAFSI